MNIYRSDGDSSSSDAEESEEETDKKANKKVAQDDFDDDGEPLAKGVPKTKNEIDVCFL